MAGSSSRHSEAYYFACCDTNNIYGTAIVADGSVLVGNRSQIVRVYHTTSLDPSTGGRDGGGESSGASRTSTAASKKRYSENGLALEQVSPSNIPPDADIISIDALPSGQVLVAYHTPSPVAGRPSKYAFNIYGSKTLSPQSIAHKLHLDWNALAEDCQVVELSFIPFHLTHTTCLLPQDRTPTMVILITADDGKVYAFAPAQDKRGGFEPMQIDLILPELTEMTTPKIIMSLDIYHSATSRIVVSGYQNGELVLLVTAVNPSASPSSTTRNHVYRRSFGGTLTRYVEHLDGSIPRVFLFSDVAGGGGTSNSSESVHLVVCGALGFAVVYVDVLKNGLSQPQILPGSSDFDAVLCAHVLDFDCDGSSQIAIGTYSGNLLLYKAQASEPGEETQAPCYSLVWQKKMPDPIFSLVPLDLDRDGVDELLVTTQKGLHVLQSNLNQVVQCVRNFLSSPPTDPVVLNRLREAVSAALHKGKTRKSTSGIPSNQSIAWMLN